MSSENRANVVRREWTTLPQSIESPTILPSNTTRKTSSFVVKSRPNRAQAVDFAQAEMTTWRRAGIAIAIEHPLSRRDRKRTINEHYPAACPPSTVSPA
jgi:hypothetical protein